MEARMRGGKRDVISGPDQGSSERITLRPVALNDTVLAERRKVFEQALSSRGSRVLSHVVLLAAGLALIWCIWERKWSTALTILFPTLIFMYLLFAEGRLREPRSVVQDFDYDERRIRHSMCIHGLFPLRQSLRWKNVREVKEGEEGIRLVTRSGDEMLVPSEAFENSEEREGFVRFARERTTHS
ncbi:MAG TPA: hypothetical protein VEX38_03105 [Fimbriimonadaceae bacterium]|nr:hypothetical protein [Fimbriimonadaceae bacterium]